MMNKPAAIITSAAYLTAVSTVLVIGSLFGLDAWLKIVLCLIMAAFSVFKVYPAIKKADIPFIFWAGVILALLPGLVFFITTGKS